MSHEIIAACARVGLTPCRQLREMLNEAPQHTTERRGCGLTQATRLLSTYINCDRAAADARDLSLFAEFPAAGANALARRAMAAGWPAGWRELPRAPAAVHDAIAGLRCTQALMALPEQLATMAATVEHEESRLVMGMLTDILSAGRSVEPPLPFMAEKPDIGSCSRAEEYFLEIGNDSVRRRGHVNIFVDASGRPVMLEKMHMGESHSAIILEPLTIGGVVIPPGGLAALRHVSADRAPADARRWQALPLSVIAAARFLRLTTLAVSPAHRERAFSTQFKRQVVLNMRGPGTTTMDDLRRFAQKRLASD